MSKTITFAGVSRLNGELKFRTATDDKRFLQLVKLGDTEVEFTGVDASTKQEAAEQLLARNFANGRAEILSLLNRVADKTPVPKAKRTIKVNAKKVAVKEKKLSIDEANALVLASMKEITPEREMELLCHRVAKKRRSRRTQVEAV